MFRKTKHNHFVGIGGIGMSGMAELLFRLGYYISGSDNQASERTLHLSNIGISIFIKHNKKNINNSDVVVFSSAIKKNNVEVLKDYNNETLAHNVLNNRNIIKDNSDSSILADNLSSIYSLLVKNTNEIEFSENL